MKPRLDQELLDNVKKALPELKDLLKDMSGHWNYEDSIYRYYHHSFKVYYVQGLTKKIVEALTKLKPEEASMNEKFMNIIEQGTGKTFELSHNKEWDKHTRPMLDAFFHAKYMLEMAVKYGDELENAPSMLPSGWAAFLYLYDMR